MVFILFNILIKNSCDANLPSLRKLFQEGILSLLAVCLPVQNGKLTRFSTSASQKGLHRYEKCGRRCKIKYCTLTYVCKVVKLKQAKPNV